MAGMNRLFAGTIVAASMTFAGCAEDKPPVTITEKLLYESGNITKVSKGQAAFVATIGFESDPAKVLIDNIDLVDNTQNHGPSDDLAPKIGDQAIRTKLVLRLSKDSLSNDGVCDSYPIETDKRFIGALALGGKEHGVMIAWPTDSDYLQVCSYQKMQPDEGLILFGTNGR